MKRRDLVGARAQLFASSLWRFPARSAARSLGSLQHGLSRGPWPFAVLLAAILGVLALGPVVLHGVVSLTEAIGVKDMFGVDDAPQVGDWISPTNVLLLFLAAAVLRWIARARERVVVEDFVDFTKSEGKAVSGLATLLVTELGRLRELYREVQTEIAVPTAVGVERQGGFGRAKEASAFLTVSADDVGDALEGAVASDAKLELGPARIPIGPLLALVNRIVRGPRVLGSVHLTEAGGGPTLTAQLVGGQPGASWRVDHAGEPESEEEQKAFLDTMVRQLACRMFTQLTLEGSVRWKAVRAFTEYLRLFEDSRRTPRDRAAFLRRAEGKLLEAVAEDESFDLAFYNLGVIYTQLAQAELAAERSSEEVTRPGDFNPESLAEARREAARVSFWRAAEKNQARWEAHYALAVTLFSSLPPIAIDERLEDDDLRGRLREIVRLCDHALALAPRRGGGRGVVYDLRGMAELRLERFAEAIASHRRAVRHAWIELCRAERRERARPATRDALLERARNNATAALHNLALAYARRGMLVDPGEAPGRRLGAGRARARHARGELNLAAADRVFRQVLRLAGDGSDLAAACRFERGVALEKRGRPERAAQEFRAAARIHPTNSEYAARRALALARSAQASAPGSDERRELERSARESVDWALRELAPTFRRSVAPFTPQSLDVRSEATLAALERAYGTLADDYGAARIRTLRRLRRTLEGCNAALGSGQTEVCIGRAIEQLEEERAAFERRTAGEPGPATRPRWEDERLRAERPDLVEDPSWEIDQIDVARARLLLRDGRAEEAAPVLQRLIARLRGGEERRIVDFGLRAELARALRETSRYDEALEVVWQCVRSDPLSANGRREAGRIHFALAQYGEALDSWEQALWLIPSDAYLHFEVAHCHRRLAHGARDAGERTAALGRADGHLRTALSLFDGEYPVGEAWVRLWRGRVALERGHGAEAVALLDGAAHGAASEAASLFLGEAHLDAGDHRLAERAFARCLAELDARFGPDADADGAGEILLDARWGDELPLGAARARGERGLAEARWLRPGGWQEPDDLERARSLLASARAHADRIADERVRTECLVLCLDSEARVLEELRELRPALDRTSERLRIAPGPEAYLSQARLLGRLAAAATDPVERERLRLAGEQACDAAERLGAGEELGAELAELCARLRPGALRGNGNGAAPPPEPTDAVRA